MRTSLLAAAAAAALLSAGAATAQNSGQTDVPSARHQNSAHANAPGTPDQTDSGAMPGPRGGMENTSDQNRNGNDVDMNAGGNMAPEQNGMRNGQMDRERMRVNETGNRTHLRLTTTQRTRIKDVVVRAHGPRLTHVTFRIGLGARVPRDVRIAVLPPEIVAIAPEWQGYSYFEYGDQIVIVDPATFAIVATLPL
ncbi:MAG TPA: DUF1236 domain-containing protein [Rhizomicrobium sp.]|jgi:hypothetical protein